MLPSWPGFRRQSLPAQCFGKQSANLAPAFYVNPRDLRQTFLSPASASKVRISRKPLRKSVGKNCQSRKSHSFCTPFFWIARIRIGKGNLGAWYVLKKAVKSSTIPHEVWELWVSIFGEILKRPTRTDCKSVDLCLHRFESCSPHEV